MQCTETLSVSDDVCNCCMYVAAVNHTGILDKGHYTTYVKLFNSSSWQFCNDAAVLRSSVEKANKNSSYIYISKAF